MMQKESRVTGRRKEIARRVSVQGVMTSRMHAKIPALKVSLHAILKGDDIRAVVGQQIPCLVVRRPVGRHPARNVTTQTARVIPEEGIRGWDRVGQVERRGERAKGDDHVLEGTRVDTAATLAGRNAVEIGRESVGARVLGVDTVAGEGGVGAVKEGRVQGIVSPLAPVPVGLGAGVAAFVAQGLFVGPGEEAVPGKEVGRGVDGKGLVDVNSNKVIVTSFGAGHLERVELRRLGHEALDG